MSHGPLASLPQRNYRALTSNTKFAPAVADLAREFAGRAVVGKLNVDQNPRTASRHGVMSIPTLLIFKNGQVVDQIVGAQPAPVLRQRLARRVG